MKEIAKLDIATPTALVAADVNGDGKPDLIIATPAGVTAFFAEAGRPASPMPPRQWGLKGIVNARIGISTAGDVNADGKIDLPFSTARLYVNDGQKFTAATQAIKLDG